MRGRRIKLGGAVAIVLVLVLVLGGAYALADEVISTAPVGLAYSKSSFTITGGQVATFSNAQGLAHSVVADSKGNLFIGEVNNGQRYYKYAFTGMEK
jgi:plastocyanin